MGSTLQPVRVDLGGLLQVMGENLYSAPHVVLRELVQNAHDSCVRRDLEAGSVDGAVTVDVDPAKGTVAVHDNGAGLTRDEIVEYLATIGTGYTRGLRTETSNEALIGQFGLGFLSAYAVAKRVVVETTSYQEPNAAWRFTSRDGQRFSITEAEPRAVGTTVTLYLRDDCLELAQLQTVRRLLERYCCLLRIPVGVPEPVNAEPPPWRIAAELSAIQLAKRRLEFAARFERSFRPITTIPLEPSTELNVRGLLWIQDGASYGSSDNRNVSLFVRGMLITSDAEELVPSWGGFVGAVVECDSLVPTASREDVIHDEVFSQLVQHIKETLVSGIASIAVHDRQAWRRTLRRHNEALLGASLCDARLFAALRDELTIPTSEGDLEIAEVKRRSDGSVILAGNDAGSHQQVWFRAIGRPVVRGDRFAVMPFVKRYIEEVGGRLVELGRRGEEALIRRVEVDDAVQSRLDRDFGGAGLAVVAARFDPPSLPALIVPDEEARLKRDLESDEADRRISQGVLSLARMYTETIERRPARRLFINLASPVIERVLESAPGRASPMATLIRYLAELNTGTEDPEADTGAALDALSKAMMQLLDGTG